MLVLRQKNGLGFSGVRGVEVMEIIARIYRDDIERFGYQF
jgi:hypothetical protein